MLPNIVSDPISVAGSSVALYRKGKPTELNHLKLPAQISWTLQKKPS